METSLRTEEDDLPSNPQADWFKARPSSHTLITIEVKLPEAWDAFRI